MEHIWGGKISELSDKTVAIEKIVQIFQELNAISACYGLIGSCAVMAHVGVAHRIPSDVDVVVSEDSCDVVIGKLKDMGFKVKSKIGYLELECNKMVIHIVVETLKLLTPDRKSVISEWRYSYDMHNLELKNLKLMPTSSLAPMRVVSREATFLSHMLAPLDSNVMFDCLMLIGGARLDAQLLENLYKMNVDVLPLLHERIRNLVLHLKVFRPPPWLQDHDYIGQTSGILKGIEDAVSC